jgi:hypothetical protein
MRRLKIPLFVYLYIPTSRNHQKAVKLSLYSFDSSYEIARQYDIRIDKSQQISSGGAFCDLKETAEQRRSAIVPIDEWNLTKAQFFTALPNPGLIAKNKHVAGRTEIPATKRVALDDSELAPERFARSKKRQRNRHALTAVTGRCQPKYRSIQWKWDKTFCTVDEFSFLISLSDSGETKHGLIFPNQMLLPGDHDYFFQRPVRKPPVLSVESKGTL